MHCDRAHQPTNKPSGEEIVLLERDEVVSVFERVKMLEGRLEVLAANATTRLDDEKKRYSEAIEELKSNFVG